MWLKLIFGFEILNLSFNDIKAEGLSLLHISNYREAELLKYHFNERFELSIIDVNFIFH